MNIEKYFNDKKYEERVKKRRNCKKCGKSVDFISDKPFIICTWCGNRIYKTNKIEFKLKTLSAMKKSTEKKCELCGNEIGNFDDNGIYEGAYCEECFNEAQEGRL